MSTIRGLVVGELVICLSISQSDNIISNFTLLNSESHLLIFVCADHKDGLDNYSNL